MPRPKCNTVQDEWFENKDAKNLQETGNIRKSETETMARDRRRAPPKAIGVVDSNVLRKIAVRYCPRLSKVKFCPFP